GTRARAALSRNAQPGRPRRLCRGHRGADGDDIHALHRGHQSQRQGGDRARSLDARRQPASQCGGGGGESLAGGMMDGTGRTALVTGATDGVGRVVAQRLAKEGWRVLVHGRNRERGEVLAREIEQAGGGATFIAADLASLAEVRRLADEVLKSTDRLHLLVNNAGIGTAGNAPGRQTRADGHELRFRVNYLAGLPPAPPLVPLPT